ncbi:hypothetical protein AAG570_010823 [Ranatra chinensis]|uniref:Uncharacterized protein n=1 Tax=Ranatra chinensis TaxID=642074 RepID=A0ABD0YIV1_9HEMI
MSTPEDSALVNNSGRGSLHNKISQHIASLAFLKHCCDYDVVPVCGKLRHHTISPHTTNILHKASIGLLQNEIREHRWTLDQLNSECYALHLQFAHTLSYDVWDKVDRTSAEEAAYSLQTRTNSLKKKFEKL